jgi:hypothetical protein
MNDMTVDEVLEHVDTIIDYLTYNNECESALYIANQLRDEIEDSLYDE